jgi:hypothetical protein
VQLQAPIGIDDEPLLVLAAALDGDDAMLAHVDLRARWRASRFAA